MTNLAIVDAEIPRQLELVRTLFQEYSDSLDVDLGFQDFENELAGLPGDYVPPGGALLLAEQEGEVIGCVALRWQEEGICEMKRLYVRPAGRGAGAGRRLAEAVIDRARELAYASMRLDTLPSMQAAQALYRKLGFIEIGAYRDNPVCTQFYELDLDAE